MQNHALVRCAVVKCEGAILVRIVLMFRMEISLLSLSDRIKEKFFDGPEATRASFKK